MPSFRHDAASNPPGTEVIIPFPDGLEWPGGSVLGVSHTSASLALLTDVTLIGFEYQPSPLPSSTLGVRMKKSVLLVRAALAALFLASGAVAAPLVYGSNPVSALIPLSSVSGWGPAETDMSNGEQAAQDGHRLSVAKTTYLRGLGVHAPSNLGYALGGQCTRFNAFVGVDDETLGQGSVAFEVLGDGKALYVGQTIKGAAKAQAVSVDVTGVKTLELRVTDGGDGVNYDHADWLSPVLKCVVWSGPLVIDKGGVYSGAWETTDENVAAVEIRTSDPVRIVNSQLRGVGHYGLIEGWHARLSVSNTSFLGLRTGLVGSGVPRALNMGQILNLDFQHNLIDHTGGIYIDQFQGDPDKGEGIKILHNRSLNADGRLSDGAGGFQQGEGQRKIVNFVQFNHVQVPGGEIGWNEDINTPYRSLVEDNVNMYVSGGSLARPILIHDNYIQGAYHIDPAGPRNFYGGGILLGDGPTERAEQNAHIRAYNNQIVGTVNYGMGIVGGQDMQIYNNRVVSSGLLPDGRTLGYTNVGLMVWNYSGSVDALFGSNTVRDNAVTFTHRKADGSYDSRNDWWLPDCSEHYLSACPNNTDLGEGTLLMERAEFASWQAKLKAAGNAPGLLK